MARFLWMVTFGMLVCLLSLLGTAGAVNLPKREKVVAADGSGDFTTITAALLSITDASATKKYVIKVRPGTYDEIVTMKPYVDIVGSGQENTVITYSGSVPYVVTGSNGTVISNILITSANLSNSLYSLPADADATIENVSLLVNANSNVRCIIDCSTGTKLHLLSSKIVSDGTVDAFDSAIETRGAVDVIDSKISMMSRQTNYPYLIGGSNNLKVKNSTLELISPLTDLIEGDIYTIENSNLYANCTNVGNSMVGCYGVWGGSGEIIGSKIKIDCPSMTCGGAAVSSTAKISNSIISSTSNGIETSPWPGYGVTEINNSEVSAGNVGIRGVNFMIGSSKLKGGHQGNAGVSKVVNCYDENFTPIPNLPGL